ncbi:MAG: ABC-2 transporter permease [Anaerococcus sp.]
MIKAILYKDLKNTFKYKDLKQAIKILILASILLIGLVIFTSKIIGYYQLLGMISVISILILASPFGSDEKSEAITYLKSTPAGAENIVRARFILNIILLVYSLIINLMAIGIIRIMNIEIDQYIKISSILLVYLVILTYSQILSAITYKFGLSKAMVAMIAGFSILVLLMVLLIKFTKINFHQVENLISKLGILSFFSIPSFHLLSHKITSFSY